MIINNEALSNINSPIRQIKAKVELFNSSSTLLHTWRSEDALQTFSIERPTEEAAFFGFGMTQHAMVTIRDVDAQVDNVNTQCYMRISYLVGDEYVYNHPKFYVTQTRRNENTNALTIYGYDVIYPASNHYTSELTITAPYTVLEYAEAVASYLGAAGVLIERVGANETCFDTYYPNGANYEGTEYLRDVLNQVAQATQTIYFVNADDYIVFKRLDDNAAADIQITKDNYFSLDTGDGRRMRGICHATQLGDNIIAETPNLTGTVQYVWDNPFWENRDDITTLVDNAFAAVGGMSIRQFDCEWRGNFLSEPGDKLAITTKEDNIVISYLLDDNISYDGAYSQSTQWHYKEAGEEESANPTSIGDMVKKTYAKVDKINQQIELAVNNSTAALDKSSKLEMDMDSISSTVTRVEQKVDSMPDIDKDEYDQMVDKVEQLPNITQTEWASLTVKVDEIDSTVERVTTKVDAMPDIDAGEYEDMKDKVDQMPNITETDYSSLKVKVDSIESTVSTTTEKVNEQGETIESLSQRVESTMTAEEVRIEIERAVQEVGTPDSIVTSTGFTFNEEGLTISKSDSEISTQITEDGMTISKGEDVVLKADNEGVKAEDLHATTYLIVGRNSRFEDYDDRTGCFWIGG